MKTVILNILILLFLLISCKKDAPYLNLKTEYVIIVVIDGARFSDTWGDPTLANIPSQSAMFLSGVLFNNFKNIGITSTTPGHTAIITGVYEDINNSGLQLPANPSIFQAWRKEYNSVPTSSWIICSKDKLEVLANCVDTEWANLYMPSANCGVNGLGLGSGYRKDSNTFVEAMTTLDLYHPNLLLINFREPDYSAHQGNWQAYLDGISDTDRYVAELWDYIQSDPIYKNKTTLFITNDHGRHLDGISSGYAGHGDDCDGCRNISLFALGPDFKGNRTITTEYDQRDIATTIAYMLRFGFPKSEGKIIRELFQ